VERIEGFCSADDRDRAWHEIREFEQQCVSARVVVVKFWLQISASEQLRRFEERAEVEHKQHKLTDEDWRNREKAPHYEAAACDAFERTHQPDAPWILVAAEDKYHARVEVLRRTVECLARSLGVEVDSIPD
jgi:polyphosphate kinase 2 (PPK2 family)